MFSLFHLMELACAVVGLAVGGLLGLRHFGAAGAIGGAVAGGVVGYCLGRVPTVLATWGARVQFRKSTTAELLSFLRGPSWPAYHMAFAELTRRGEDVTKELGVAVGLMLDSDVVKRIHGATILELFFPDQAQRLPGYDPKESMEICRDKVEKAGITSG